jgi:predicted nucleic acid-binding protein
MVLADTSVWVDFARRGERGGAAPMRGLLDAGEVATCGPVVAELLAGAEGEVAERMAATLFSLPWAPLDPPAFREVGELAGALRRSGRVLPLTDQMIAVATARAGHVLWSFDSGFERLALELPALELYSP